MLSSLRIGIVGNGVVGGATARAWLEHAREVRVYDAQKERATHILPEVMACDLIFVCLPTPQQEGGLHHNLDALHAFGALVMGSNANIVLKSTVPIGTTWRLRGAYDLQNLVHSPEFLTARCANIDAQVPSSNVIGSPECACRDMLSAAYLSRFPWAPLFAMDSDESEALKLVKNSFFAAKVAFFNEARALADAKGLRWQKIMEALLTDGRICPSHTQVPGPDGRYGFGGSCLPKDLAAFAGELEGVGLPATMARAALERNRIDRGR